MKSNIDLLKEFTGYFQTDNLQDWQLGCDQYCSDDLEIHEPPGLPQQGVFKGRYAPIEISKIYRGIWEFEIGPMEFWEAEDIVFTRYVLSWTSKLGKSVTQPVVELNYFRDGKIVKMEVFMFNPIGLLATLAP